MNKYCQIYPNQKKFLFIIDNASEMQFIKELIFLNKYIESTNEKQPVPEILFLKSTFNNLIENNTIKNKLKEYFNKFQHIIINLDFSINIQIISVLLYNYNVSTYYPIISKQNISYHTILSSVYRSYNLYNIASMEIIKINYKNIYYNNIFPTTHEELINKNIYENFYKIINLRSIDYRDGLTSLEREVVYFLLTNYIQETTCLQIFYAITTQFHYSINGLLLKKIRNFVENFSYNNTLNIFIPKSYIIYNTTEIYINQPLLKILFLYNIHNEFKNDKIYFTSIPLIYYSSRTFYQYNLNDYINICINFLKTKTPIKFNNIPLEYENEYINIKKYKNRIKIVSKYENNVLYRKLPRLNFFKAFKYFSKFDSKFKYSDQKFIFSKPINKKYYITFNNLSHKVLYKNSYKTLLELSDNYAFYTTKHMLNTELFLEFIVTIKFIEYLHVKSLFNYRNIIFQYFCTKFNTKECFDLGLIFPFNSFYTEDNLYKIFYNYKMHNIGSLNIFFYDIINKNNIMELDYNKYWIIINKFVIDLYINNLNELLNYLQYKEEN